MGRFIHLLLTYTLCLVPVSVVAQTTYYTAQKAGDGLAVGSDNYACEQAKAKATPRASLNRGIACLKGGDTLIVGPGTYDELVRGQTSSSLDCGGDSAAQQPCHPIPNGLEPGKKTTLLATSKAAIVSPVGRQLPGGGAVFTLHDYVRHVQIEGFKIVKNAASGSVGGVYMGSVQYVTVKNNELDDGQIKGGVTSKYLQVVGNHVYNTGKKSCPAGVKPTPSGCPHGMYICGTDHTITDNHVHDTSYYGIQVSCEQGGIARIKLERNRVENNPVVGIRCAGSDCFVGANVLVGNGIGITVSGSGTVTNNTIHDWYHPAEQWGQDPWGIYGDLGSYTVTNNLRTNMKSAFSAISENAKPPNASKAHHNMCELAGNVGCTLVAPDTAIYNNAVVKDFRLKTGSPAIDAGANVVPAKDVTGSPYYTRDLGAYAYGALTPPIQDTEPPSVALTNPPANEQVFGTTLPLIARVSDPSGVGQVVFQVDGVDVGPGSKTTGEEYRYVWDTTSVPNGAHTFTAQATDTVGNTGAAPLRTLNVQNEEGPVPPDPPGTAALLCTGDITVVPGPVSFRCVPETAKQP